ncbi:MAG: DUF3783 domain-containing protein [Clostridia bacterium]|nr:DUF3783 domain-containing protein [Clostridia bacterium]
MAGILLFNIEGEKLQRIRAVSSELGLECVSVDAQYHLRPLCELIGAGPIEANASAAACYDGSAAFADEMLVMNALDERTFGALLHCLRRDGAPVALKAIVTEHNLPWTAAQLHAELKQEHERIAEMLRARREGADS